MDDRLLSYLYCFNVSHDYFECHEYGESLWLSTGRPDILKGLIQTAVCIYHLEGGNVRGGIRMWTRARKYLVTYTAKNSLYEGIDIDALQADMDNLWARVPIGLRTQTMHRNEVMSLKLPRVTIRFVPEDIAAIVRSWIPTPLPDND